MRAMVLTSALLSGLIVSGGAVPAFAQAASRDGEDLPCNEACRSWMGPAYTGPQAGQSEANTPSENDENSAQSGDMGPPPGPAVSRPPVRRFVHERSRFRPERSREDSVVAEDRPFVPSHAHFAPKPALTALRRPAHRVASVAAALRAAEPAKPVAVASKEDSNASASLSVVSGGPSARLGSDGKTMTVSLNGSPSQDVRLTTEQADRLLQAVGAARAQMQPQPQQNWAFGQTVTTIYDPRWTTEAEHKKGDTLLHIRDPRFGWLHYTVPRMTAQQLGNLLEKQVARPAPSARRAEATP